MNTDPAEEAIQLIQENTRIHNQVHLRYSHIRDITQIHSDISCSTCYPINRNFSPQFIIFWDWAQTVHQAIECTSETINIFEQIRLEQSPVQLIQLVRILFISIRYRVYPESLNIIVRDYFTAARGTHHFNIALEEVIQSSPELTQEDNPSDLESNSDNNSEESHSTINGDLSDSEEDNLIIRRNSARRNSDSDSDSDSTLGLDQLFNLQLYQQLQQLVPMANQQDIQNLTDALNQVFNAFHPVPAVAPELSNVKYPEYYGGDQDPITWLEEMEQAFIANRVTDARKVPVAVPRLKAGAATWWNQVQANINRWNDATDANTIAASF